MAQIPRPRFGNEPAADPASVAPGSPFKGYFPLLAARDLVLEPLRALELLVHLLRQPTPPRTARATVAEIARGLGDVERVVGQVFDLLSLDAGAVRPHHTVIAVDDLFAALETDCHDRAMAARCVLRTVPCRVMVQTDPALMGRILEEFVTNALSHAAPMRVLVGCRRTGGRLRIEVRDDGTGIMEGATEEVFEPLMRLGDGNDGAGAGLGLYIVRRLAALLGHDTGVKSVLHHGSVFSITVPVVPVRGRLGPARG